MINIDSILFVYGLSTIISWNTDADILSTIIWTSSSAWFFVKLSGYSESKPETIFPSFFLLILYKLLANNLFSSSDGYPLFSFNDKDTGTPTSVRKFLFFPQISWKGRMLDYRILIHRNCTVCNYSIRGVHNSLYGGLPGTHLFRFWPSLDQDQWVC